MKFDRENFLRERLNSFLVGQFNLPENDYYSLLTADGFISLKSALQDINNILTMKVTLSFVSWLSDHYKLDQSARNELRQIALESKPNSNGYDIWLGYPVCFVGEVKCNMPINNGTIYGSAQKLGIERDIHGLLRGKRKAPLNPST